MGELAQQGPQHGQGKRLDLWLEERPRSWREVVTVFRDVGRSLAAAHAAGTAHQEVRIDNIYVGSGGGAELRDLQPAVRDLPKIGPAGLRTAAVSLERRLEQVPSAEAAAFLAPEQFKGWVADARSNQFNFCVALYRALYHQAPFDHDWAVSQMGDSRLRRTPLGSIRFDLVVKSLDRKSLIDLAREVLAGNLRPPPEDTDVPSWLDEVLRRGLRSEPDERYRSMNELLREMAQGMGDRARPDARRGRGDTVKWAIVGGIGLVLILGFAAKLAGLIP